MKKTVVYFHGYGSNPNSDKTQMLRKHFENVYAFPIDVDPDKSLPYLEQELEKVLSSHENVVFVGTSLGGWYAGYMAKKFNVTAVLINPCFSFKAVKIDLGIAETIKQKYEKIGFQYPENSRFFISANDEVIDFEGFEPKHVEWFFNTGHRFNGPEFQDVIEYVEWL